MEVLRKLVRSRKFWLSLFAVVQTIVFASVPNFNPQVWQAIDALVVVLISTIAYEDGQVLRGRGA